MKTGRFDDLMSAISFAEAGEHEKARELLRGRDTILLATSERAIDRKLTGTAALKPFVRSFVRGDGSFDPVGSGALHRPDRQDRCENDIGRRLRYHFRQQNKRAVRCEMPRKTAT